MSSETDLSKIPHGSTIVIHDLRMSFARRFNLPNIRTDLKVVYAHPRKAKPAQYKEGYAVLSCRVPCDHVPARSWALFKARDLLRELVRTIQAEQALGQAA